MGSMLFFCEPSARWVWQSMRPGRTVEFVRSMVFAVVGIGRSGPTWAMVPFSRMRMIWLVRRREWVTSMSLPARMARVMGGAVDGCCAEVAIGMRRIVRERKRLRMVRGFYLVGARLGS